MLYHAILEAYGICLDGNSTSLCVLHEPRPSTSLNARKRSVELLLHCIEAAVVGVDGLGETARWWLTASRVLGREVLPEERVVNVTTCYPLARSCSCFCTPVCAHHRES